jgi:hypothetical protein
VLTEVCPFSEVQSGAGARRVRCEVRRKHERVTDKVNGFVPVARYGYLSGV